MKISEDICSYDSLKNSSLVSCDFCDRKFNNRYDSIIHNASHIIIPLWSQTLYKCDLCDIYTTTVDDIQAHICNKHTLIKTRKKQNKIQNETTPDCIKNVVKLNGDKGLDENKPAKNEPIRNRLKFEDDIISSDSLMDDLGKQCDVKVDDPPWTHPLELSEYKNGLIYGDDLFKTNINNVSVKVQDTESGNVIEEPAYNCIHYASLIRPGIFICKYCSKSYPNRFSLIKHEMYHIKIVRRNPILCLYCDKFIAGNYKTLNVHIAKRHPNVKAKKFKTFNCKRCGLKFRKYKRHVRNYHVYDCLDCGLELDDPEESAKHLNTCKCPKYKTKILKVCDLCYSFMKRRINLIYCLMGDTISELGVRYPCDNCGKKFFVLKMVKRLQKERQCCNRDQKKLTNEDRLKNIQHRLKKLNLLNKF